MVLKINMSIRVAFEDPKTPKLRRDDMVCGAFSKWASMIHQWMGRKQSSSSPHLSYNKPYAK